MTLQCFVEAVSLDTSLSNACKQDKNHISMEELPVTIFIYKLQVTLHLYQIM